MENIVRNVNMNPWASGRMGEWPGTPVPRHLNRDDRFPSEVHTYISQEGSVLSAAWTHTHNYNTRAKKKKGRCTSDSNSFTGPKTGTERDPVFEIIITCSFMVMFGSC